MKTTARLAAITLIAFGAGSFVGAPAHAVSVVTGTVQAEPDGGSKPVKSKKPRVPGGKMIPMP